MKPLLMPKDNPDLSTLTYPVWVYPKLDGIRCLTTNKGPVSRTLKNIPNKHIFNYLYHNAPAGLDGELIVGHPTDKDVYRNTNSVVMSHDKVCDFKYFVFDDWREPNKSLWERTEDIVEWDCDANDGKHILVLHPLQAFSAEEVLEHENYFVEQGYEGIIIRNPNAMYKYGRCTTKENNSYKLKRYVDDEAVIVRAEPEYENTNEAFTNELGRTARSTEKAGMVAKPSLGALLAENDKFGMFYIGTGWSKQEREDLWKLHQKEGLHNLVVKFKYFPVGIKDKPRHPVFLGFRDMEIDG
jgi:DNA ligase 1